MNVKKRERAPIKITLADVERAYKKVKEFQLLVEHGKTPEQIFKDLLKLIDVYQNISKEISDNLKK